MDRFSYRIINLTDVADVERAKKNFIYDAETIYFQNSASKGQIGILKKSGTIETKNVVIKPRKSLVNPYYLLLVIEMEKERFMKRFMEGINIPVEAFNFLKIKFHDSIKMQSNIVNVIKQIELLEEKEKEVIESYKKLKDRGLNKMFV